MGNSITLSSISPCFNPNPSPRPANSRHHVKLIYWEGSTRLLTGSKHVAGEIMFECPESIVCHADSFFIGRPIPSLAIDDLLIPGHTYFVLPLDYFPPSCTILSSSSLAALGSSSPSANINNNCNSSLNLNTNSSPNVRPSPIKFGDQGPFEYRKDSDGRLVIKVMPEFIIRLLTKGKEEITDNGPSSSRTPSPGSLCSTPELQKHYEQLVGSRGQVWSPKLETISEYKIRFSPCRLIGFERIQKEK